MGNFDAPTDVTMKEFLEELRKEIIGQLQEWRIRAATVRGNKLGEAFVNARIELLERLSIFIVKSQKKGAIDMKELKVELGETGSLDELMENEHGGVIEPAIQEIAKRLRVNTYERIDNRQDVLKGITWNHFSGRVYRMQESQKLGNEFSPVKRKTKFYLAHFPPEVAKQMYEKRMKRRGMRMSEN